MNTQIIIFFSVLLLFSCKENKKTTVKQIVKQQQTIKQQPMINKKKNNATDTIASTEIKKIIKSAEEWREILTDQEFKVLRQKGTERAFTGEYYDHKGDGIYHCKACDLPLFDSKTKFKSGTGWPSFWEKYHESHVGENIDHSFGMQRIEVICNRCESHLGHVFTDGPKPTGLRYCINSICLTFKDR